MKGDYHKWGVWKLDPNPPKWIKLTRGKWVLLSSHKTEVRARYVARDCGWEYKVMRV